MAKPHSNPEGTMSFLHRQRWQKEMLDFGYAGAVGSVRETVLEGPPWDVWVCTIFVRWHRAGWEIRLTGKKTAGNPVGTHWTKHCSQRLPILKKNKLW